MEITIPHTTHLNMIEEEQKFREFCLKLARECKGCPDCADSSDEEETSDQQDN